MNEYVQKYNETNKHAFYAVYNLSFLRTVLSLVLYTKYEPCLAVLSYGVDYPKATKSFINTWIYIVRIPYTRKVGIDSSAS